jgi:hypothetical protein
MPASAICEGGGLLRGRAENGRQLTPRGP